MMRNVSRRIERLETRIAAAARLTSFSVRVRLVDPQDGLVGVLVLESGKPTMEVPATPAEQESFRAHTLSKRHRAPSNEASDNKH